jgi:hypothetical protein
MGAMLTVACMFLLASGAMAQASEEQKKDHVKPTTTEEISKWRAQCAAEREARTTGEAPFVQDVKREAAVEVVDHDALVRAKEEEARRQAVEAGQQPREEMPKSMPADAGSVELNVMPDRVEPAAGE